MRRKPLWLALGLLTFIGGSVLATLVLLVQHVPAFYERSAIPAGPQREEVSAAFASRWMDLFDLIKAGGNPETGGWGARSNQDEINSYFAEHFQTWGESLKWLPEGVSDPRIAIQNDTIRLGFRYGTPPWSTIISITFRVWLAQSEPNVIVLELRGLHAGALPIAAQSLLEDISEALRSRNIQVSWYRYQGNPTAALKFQSDQPRPTSQLRQLEIKSGMLIVAGQGELVPPSSGSASAGTGSSKD